MRDFTSSGVFLCPQEVPFLGGEHVYGRNPQRVTWWTSGDFIGHDLLGSRLTENILTESHRSGAMSGHYQGMTSRRHPCCSMVPSSISTSHFHTLSRPLLGWHLFREALLDHSILRAASLRCCSISLVLYHCWTVAIWKVVYFMSPSH